MTKSISSSFIALVLCAGGLDAQLSSVRQEIYGMD